jgi:hypothetical protein
MIYMSTRAPIIILASSSSPSLQIASSTASLYFHSDVGARDPFDLINFVDSFLRPFHEQFLFPFQNRDGRSLIAPQGSLVHPFFLDLSLETPPTRLASVSQADGESAGEPGGDPSRSLSNHEAGMAATRRGCRRAPQTVTAR